MTNPRNSPRTPATIPIPALPLPQALPNLLLLTTLTIKSLHRPQPLSPTNLRISLPKISLPNISLPKISLPQISLPQISLPEVNLPVIGKIGGKSDKQQTKTASEILSEARRNTSGSVTPRVGSSSGVNVKVSVGRRGGEVGKDAPTMAELQKERGVVVGSSGIGLGGGEGWKRFPGRRMPGANLDGWKKMAKGMVKD